MSISLIFTTAPDENTARVIASSLIELRLAACVKLLPAVTSFYRWEGKVENDTECQILIKTSEAAMTNAYAQVCKLHPYDVPEWVVIDGAKASKAYETWVHNETAGAV